MESVFDTIIGFVAFGAIWYFFLKPKKVEVLNDELKLKEEELKNTQINLATRDAEIKAAEDAKESLESQLKEKKTELTIYIK